MLTWDPVTVFAGTALDCFFNYDFGSYRVVDVTGDRRAEILTIQRRHRRRARRHRRVQLPVGLHLGAQTNVDDPNCEDLGRVRSQSLGPGTVVLQGTAADIRIGVLPAGQSCN